jgi:sugar O-acyltransferase (sialic acid O-acetyltransferase NeuD family)
MSTDLVLVGAGGFARETLAAVYALNASQPTWRPLGYLDEDPDLHGVLRAGLPVLGGLDRLAGWPGAAVVVCTGGPRDYGSRARLVARLALPAHRYATIVHPGSTVPPGCSLGRGSVLLAGVTLTTAVEIGAHVAVMPQVVLTHDDVVEDFVTIAAGVRLGGGVTVGRGAYLGAGALVRELVTVGAGAQVGLGSVVLRDVPPGEVWVGNPAHRLRAAPGAPAADPSPPERSD